jgi:hypothetical protein
VELQTQRSVKCIGPLMEPTHRRTSMRTGMQLRCPPAGRYGSYAESLENCDDSGRIIRFKDVCEHFLPSHLPIPRYIQGLSGICIVRIELQYFAQFQNSILPPVDPAQCNSPSIESRPAGRLNYKIFTTIVLTLGSGACAGRSIWSVATVWRNFNACPVVSKCAEITLACSPSTSSADDGQSNT